MSIFSRIVFVSLLILVAVALVWLQGWGITEIIHGNWLGLFPIWSVLAMVWMVSPSRPTDQIVENLESSR